ncbi:MAG: hypothetical protein QM723_15085 [Myxococcaceae bacterium]
MLRFAPLLLLLAACATTPKGSVGRCPGSNQTACLTTENCEYDAADNCNRCICQDSYIPPEQVLPPSGAPIQR